MTLKPCPECGCYLFGTVCISAACAKLPPRPRIGRLTYADYKEAIRNA